MDAGAASWLLTQEARALLDRLARIKSFALQETMVPAAALSVQAQSAVERHLSRVIHRVRNRVLEFLDWLASSDPAAADPAECQRRFTLLRLRFNAVLSHVDIFSEALSQRSEAETGVWLGGLDVVCSEALTLQGYVEPPPVVCYLARGPGAAIRRARTRLPGGGENPIAIVRVPRERMISSSLASSLVHEVGHQGAALLDLVRSVREDLKRVPSGIEPQIWELFSRWASEIIADFWSIAKLGITSTTGLLGVVSLPAPFVFRLNLLDPHPTPYLRVKLSAAIGNALYPHPQWRALTELWTSLYPTGHLDPGRRELFTKVEAAFPAFTQVLCQHRPRKLGGLSLGEALTSTDRTPKRLAALRRTCDKDTAVLARLAPTLAFAVIGQARFNGSITPEREGALLAALLRHWAWRNTVIVSEVCAQAHSGITHQGSSRFHAAAVR